ncbi:MAG: ornithine carbamoyltransferase, partial [Rhodomicrobium sp.]|nr:ornithine carbamoyltransferase [Rhodomicrobium sp.]
SRTVGFALHIARRNRSSRSRKRSPGQSARGARLALFEDPREAVAGADCIVTDVWVSMGQNDEERRLLLLKDYQVNSALMTLAGRDAIFMHCLPAQRGREVTDEVIDGPQSVVFDEAENRVHAQRTILAWCLEKT